MDWAGGQGRGGGGEWRAELVGIVMVSETTRKGKGPGKWPGRAIEMEKRDVSGFVQEENLGCPYHEDIFVRTQDSARMPLPCLGKVGPLLSSSKHRQAGRQGRAPGSDSELGGLPRFGLRWTQSWRNSG